MFCCHSVEVEQRNAHLLFSAELRLGEKLIRLSELFLKLLLNFVLQNIRVIQWIHSHLEWSCVYPPS